MSETILYRASTTTHGRPSTEISKVKVQKIKGHMFYDLSGKRRFLKGKLDKHFYSFGEAKDFLWKKAEEHMERKRIEFEKSKIILKEIANMEDPDGTKTHARTQKDRSRKDR